LSVGGLCVEVDIDESALPLLVRVEIAGGTPPYHVSLRAVDALGHTHEFQRDVTDSTAEFPLQSNGPFSLTVDVIDFAQQTQLVQLQALRQIKQGESFALDGGRYQQSAKPSDRSDDGSWMQILPAGTDEYWSSTELGMEPAGPSLVITSAPWPGIYRLQYAEETSLDVLISPSSTLAIRGMCNDYAPRPLGYTHLEENLEHMKRVGVNAIQFIKLLFMDSETGTTIRDSSPFPYWDDLLACAIERAKEQGFTVMLRLVIMLDAPWPKADNLQDRLEPSDWDAWFAEYERYELKYADLAESAGVDIYAFSDTLQTTYSHVDRYRELIARIRDTYSGELTILTGPYAERLDEVPFWDALDYIGLDGSLHSAAYVDYQSAADLTTDQLYGIYRQAFEENVLPTAREFRKPILWGEVYYNSVLRSTYSANGLPISEFIRLHDEGDAADFELIPSYAEQAKGYDATLRVIHDYRDLIVGLFALQWTLEDPLLHWCCNLGTHTIPFTPAETVFRIWWNPNAIPEEEESTTFAVDCSQFAEFSESGYRGFWTLDSFGHSHASTERRVYGPEAVPVECVVLTYANPSHDFLRLRYTMHPEQRDYSDYTGVVLALSASERTDVLIEVAFGEREHEEWIPSFSDPIEIDSEIRFIQIPFENLEVPTREMREYALSSNRPDSEDIVGLGIWPQQSRGEIYIYGIGVYR